MSYEHKAQKQKALNAKQRAAENFGPALAKLYSELKVYMPSHSTQLDIQLARIKDADEKEQQAILDEFYAKCGSVANLADAIHQNLIVVDDHAETTPNFSFPKCWSRLTAPPQKKLSTQFQFVVKLANIALH
jgi:hypothetical protein